MHTRRGMYRASYGSGACPTPVVAMTNGRGQALCRLHRNARFLPVYPLDTTKGQDVTFAVTSCPF